MTVLESIRVSASPSSVHIRAPQPRKSYRQHAILPAQLRHHRRLRPPRVRRILRVLPLQEHQDLHPALHPLPGDVLLVPHPLPPQGPGAAQGEGHVEAPLLAQRDPEPRVVRVVSQRPRVRACPQPQRSVLRDRTVILLVTVTRDSV